MDENFRYGLLADLGADVEAHPYRGRHQADGHAGDHDGAELEVVDAESSHDGEQHRAEEHDGGGHVDEEADDQDKYVQKEKDPEGMDVEAELAEVAGRGQGAP